MKSKFLPYLALFTASVLWGITSPVMKITLESVPLFSLAFIRFFCASLLLYPLVKNSLHIKPKHYLLLLITGLTGISLVIFFFFAGIKLTTAMNGSILLGTVPIHAVIVAIFLRQKVGKEVFIGLLLGILGVIIIFSEHLLKLGIRFAPQGDLLVLLSAFSFAVYQVFSKKLFKWYRPLAISFYTFVIGAITFLPFAVQEYSTHPMWYINLPQKAVLGILFGIICSSTLAFSLWQWGLSKMDPTHAGFFYYFNPVTGIIASYFLLSEPFTVQVVIGAVLIFSGVFVSQQHHKHPIVKTMIKR